MGLFRLQSYNWDWMGMGMGWKSLCGLILWAPFLWLKFYNWNVPWAKFARNIPRFSNCLWDIFLCSVFFLFTNVVFFVGWQRAGTCRQIVESWVAVFLNRTRFAISVAFLLLLPLLYLERLSLMGITFSFLKTTLCYFFERAMFMPEAEGMRLEKRWKL